MGISSELIAGLSSGQQENCMQNRWCVQYTVHNSSASSSSYFFQLRYNLMILTNRVSINRINFGLSTQHNTDDFRRLVVHNNNKVNNMVDNGGSRRSRRSWWWLNRNWFWDLAERRKGQSRPEAFLLIGGNGILIRNRHIIILGAPNWPFNQVRSCE